MPLPILFIGAAAATSLFGASKTAKAVSDNSKAKEINRIANESVETARQKLEVQRAEVSDSFENLGSLKIDVLQHNVMEFIETYEKIKNIDLTETEGINELKNFHVDHSTFEELKQLGHFACSVAGGVSAGAVGGALTAFGAYSAAMALGTASTGTAISTLSGVAATNATLAFFGGGSLAAGGLGMAGGLYVLGGLVAGPALTVMGLIVGAKAQEKMNKALENKAQADEITESLNAASDQCSAIRRRTYLFYNLLTELDSRFLPMIWGIQKIIETEGNDYRLYSQDARKALSTAFATAASIKAVLDTPILSEEGELTKSSEKLIETISPMIYAVQA